MKWLHKSYLFVVILFPNYLAPLSSLKACSTVKFYLLFKFPTLANFNSAHELNYVFLCVCVCVCVHENSDLIKTISLALVTDVEFVEPICIRCASSNCSTSKTSKLLAPSMSQTFVCLLKFFSTLQPTLCPTMIADTVVIHQQMFNLIVPDLPRHCLEDFAKGYT